MICMLNNIKKILFFNSVICLIITSGCIDNPVIPQGSINGSVYDKYGMPIPYTLVSIGEYPIIGLDGFGNFSIDNTAFPYDLTISRKQVATKYMGLTIHSTKCFSFNEFGYGRNCIMFVSYPPLDGSNRAIIKFISKDVNTQFDYYSFSDTLFEIHVGIMPDKDKIEGKLIFLQYTSYFGIKSFDKFGVKDITLYTGSNPNIRFTEQDVSYNPKEITMPFSIQFSGNYEDFYSLSSINFHGMNHNSELEIFYPEEYHSGYIIVPELPGLDYKIKFTNYLYYYDDLRRTQPSIKWVYVNPRESISLQHNETIKLILPANGEGVITDTTKFIFTDSEPGGIYVYYITNNSPFYSRIHLNIATEKYPLEFKDFKTRGVTFKPNETYYWSVKKYPGYKSIDEFTSRKIIEDTTYSSIPSSANHYFIIK